MKFCANISLLFTEVPFLERFAAARSAGFDAVEMWWPRGENLDAVEAAVADAGVEVVLLNFDAGDMPAGDRGVSATRRASTSSTPTCRSRSRWPTRSAAGS